MEKNELQPLNDDELNELFGTDLFTTGSRCIDRAELQRYCQELAETNRKIEEIQSVLTRLTPFLKRLDSDTKRLNQSINDLREEQRNTLNFLAHLNQRLKFLEDSFFPFNPHNRINVSTHNPNNPHYSSRSLPPKQ